MLLVPEIPLEINREHPITHGLLEAGYALGGRAAFSAIRKAQPFVSGTGTPAASKFGRAITLNGSPNHIDLGRNISASTAVASGFVMTRVNSLAAVNTLLTSALQSGNNHVGHFFQTTTAGVLWAHYGDGTAANAAARRSAESAASTVGAGETFSAGFVCRGATDWSLYKNGVSLTPTYSGTGGGYAAGTANGSVNLRDFTTTPQYGDQSVSLWGFWNRALSGAEMLLLAHDPFCIFRYEYDEFYYSAPVSGAFQAAWAAGRNVLIGAGVA